MSDKSNSNVRSENRITQGIQDDATSSPQKDDMQTLQEAVDLITKHKENNVRQFQQELSQLLQKYDIALEIDPPTVSPRLVIRSN